MWDFVNWFLEILVHYIYWWRSIYPFRNCIWTRAIAVLSKMKNMWLNVLPMLIDRLRSILSEYWIQLIATISILLSLCSLRCLIFVNISHAVHNCFNAFSGHSAFVLCMLSCACVCERIWLSEELPACLCVFIIIRFLKMMLVKTNPPPFGESWLRAW